MSVSKEVMCFGAIKPGVRKPTADEALGMAWWNHMSEFQRALICSRADTAIPAEAWAYLKRTTSEGPQFDGDPVADVCIQAMVKI